MTIQQFCAKYHAVPATASGSALDWAGASDEALAGWAAEDAAAWDSQPANRPHLADRMKAQRAELWARLQAFGEMPTADAPPARKLIRNAWYNLGIRVGF
jgi:hypothetical protein